MFRNLIITAASVVLATASAGAATISYVGNQDNVEADGDDPTSGWRNASPAKTFDIDGDNVIGTDGYQLFGVGAVSLPSYIANVTRVSSNNNAGAWTSIDDPSNPGGADINTGVWHGGGNDLTIDIFSFQITGTALDGQTLRVGILYDTHWSDGTLDFTLNQTAGGSATATSGTQTVGADGMDVVFFDLDNVSSGDVFTLNAQGASTVLTHAGGVAFDTAPVPEPSAVLLGALGSLLVLRRRR